MNHFLSVELLSDACFSGGIGHAGEVDTDIDHEKSTGLPIVRGRILKGLLVEECAMILKALPEKPWRESAARLFGDSGRRTGAVLSLGDGRLPESLRRVFVAAIDRGAASLSVNQVLRSFTDIRHQTKVNFQSGAPEPHSLRATRVALKGLVFQSNLYGTNNLTDEDKALFAACALSIRCGGMNRNSGWGKLRVRVMDKSHGDVTPEWVSVLHNNEEGGQDG